MKKSPVGFAKFSTAGNTTLFIDQNPHICQAMQIIAAEQGGVINRQDNLVGMAGGEFCLNACLAYGALLALSGCHMAVMRMADIHVKISTCGQKPFWFAKASFASSICKKKQVAKKTVIELPGITHILIPTQTMPCASDATEIGKKLFADLGLEKEPAAGVVWWKHNDDELEIMPLVLVPAAGTLNLEGACGSGSVALAYSSGPGNYKIRQPSGEILCATIKKDQISLRAPVNLMSMGEIWLG